MEQLNMLGQPCPIPVVQAKRALASPDVKAVEVLVDNMVAVQNLEKMAKGTGCGFGWQKTGDSQYTATITKTDATGNAFTSTSLSEETAPAQDVCAIEEGVTVLVAQSGMGGGSEELGRILIKGFIFSLTELNPPPKSVIFLNGGAHLTTEGANTVPDLKTLEEKGTEVLTCGTCANYYGLTEKLAVGSITDMFGITTRLASAARLISL